MKKVISGYYKIDGELVKVTTSEVIDGNADIQELELSYRNAVFAGELLELIVRDKTIILQGRAEFVTGIYK